MRQVHHPQLKKKEIKVDKDGIVVVKVADMRKQVCELHRTRWEK